MRESGKVKFERSAREILDSDYIDTHLFKYNFQIVTKSLQPRFVNFFTILGNKDFISIRAFEQD